MQSDKRVFLPYREGISSEEWIGMLHDIMSAKNLTVTDNGALVPITTGSAIIDQFSKAGNFRGRDMDRVSKDMEVLWDENPEHALRLIFYLRMITRTIKLTDSKVTEKLQKGQGVRDEAFKRLLWVAQNHPESFYQNIWLLPFVGSWKDLWTLMLLAKKLKIDLNYQAIYALLFVGLSNDNQRDLVLKYMPRIKTKSNITTEDSRILSYLARGFAKYLDLTPRLYNKLKSTGNAHEFQKLISSGEYSKLKWSHIPGLALGKLTSSKFLTNHSLLEDFMGWLTKQDSVKFNGYPYDLLVRLKKSSRWGNSSSLLSSPYSSNPRSAVWDEIPEVVKRTVDLQFKDLIDKVEAEGKWTENVLCALDTSGSMSCNYNNSQVAPIDVCLSLGIYFSTLNKGFFKDKVMFFDYVSEIVRIKGSFTEKLSKIKRNAMGSTNFESVLDCLVDYRKQHPEAPLHQFPTTLLVVSDMQFNPMSRQRFGFRERGGIISTPTMETVYDSMKKKLCEAFPVEFVDNMKFIWWNVNGTQENLPATKDDKGCIFLSGMDGSAISFVLGEDDKELDKKEKKKLSAEEVVQNALNQEILQYIKVN